MKMIRDMIQIGSQGVIRKGDNSGETLVTQKITNVPHESECEESAEYERTWDSLFERCALRLQSKSQHALRTCSDAQFRWTEHSKQAPSNDLEFLSVSLPMLTTSRVILLRGGKV